jgi:hypothetical protein
MTIEQAIPLAIGIITFLVTGTDFLVRKWIQKHRDETIKDLTDKRSAVEVRSHQLDTDLAAARLTLVDVTREPDVATAEVGTLLAANREQSTRIAELDAEVTRLAQSQEDLTRTQRTHDNRIRRALELEGAIWTQPVMTGTRPFRPLAERRTPIVSVLNLKGGVGKTTLTAYLGWALAHRGYRVLLVDLDLQGSLSSLFYPADELARLAREGHLLQHYLADVTRRKGVRLLDYALPVPQLNPRSRLVATTDRLAYAELSQTVRWLLRVGGTARQWNGRHDGRMILRRALHAAGLSRRFDVVLLDCLRRGTHRHSSNRGYRIRARLPRRSRAVGYEFGGHAGPGGTPTGSPSTQEARGRPEEDRSVERRFTERGRPGPGMHPARQRGLGGDRKRPPIPATDSRWVAIRSLLGSELHYTSVLHLTFGQERVG